MAWHKDFSQFVVSLVFLLLASATAASAASTVILGNDRCTNALNLLVLFLDFFGVCLWVGIKPRLSVLQGIQNLLFLVRVHLFTQTFVLARTFRGGTHGMNVPIKRVFRIYTLLDLLVLVRELLGLFDHL